ncbi:hypothetical protein ABKN59_009116 [Abortiporus biennis]
MASNLQDWKKTLNDLQARLYEFNDEDYIEESENRDDDRRQIISGLAYAVELVRRAEQSDHPDAPEIFKAVEKIIEETVRFATEDDAYFDNMPSFGHGDKLITDPLKKPARGSLNVLYKMQLLGQDTSNYEERFPTLPHWVRSLQPPKATVFSRFRKPARGVTTTFPDIPPVAQYIYEARCEISPHDISIPLTMAMSSDCSAVVVSTMGGYKNRDPLLTFYLPQDPDPVFFRLKAGLCDHARQLAMDESRKLVFAGDWQRIKSYSWALDADKRRGLPTHTLKSDDHEGPIAVLGNRLIRAGGKGTALSWNIDELETHGTRNENKIIGEGEFKEDSWRETGSPEQSPGSEPHSSIPFGEDGLKLRCWHLHKPTGHMLCGQTTQYTHEEVGLRCVGIDLEHGGKIVSKYIGHGDNVCTISTSEDDPSLFLTAALDGYARLFDVRMTCPVMTFDYEHDDNKVQYKASAIYVHPGGIPSVFTGGDLNESIKFWDVRAGRTVYDLSTASQKMSDINKTVKVPRFAENDRKYYEDGAFRDRWPRDAYHDEDYYGSIFYSETDAFLAYRFMENPS